MKRVLILIKGLGRGGAEQLLVSAAPYLERTDFEYEVAYLLPWKNALIGALERHGIPVYCLDGGRGASWIPRLKKLVHERDIGLIHVHSPYAAIGTRLAFRKSAVPIVTTEHIVWESYHRATYWGNLLTFGINDHVFAVSDHVRNSIRYPRGFRHLRRPPIETLYHGLDPADVQTWTTTNGVRHEFGIPQDAPIIGTVANFKAHKGYEYLIDAALRVKDALPDARFIWVGRGPLEATIRKKVVDAGLSESVIVAGYREDAVRVAASFDIFALGSIHEGLSIALIEALALGKPAVVPDAGGLTEVVEHEQQGLVVAPRDGLALAEGILTLLRNDNLRTRYGEAARERAAIFDIRKAATRMHEVYSSLT